MPRVWVNVCVCVGGGQNLFNLDESVCLNAFFNQDVSFDLDTSVHLDTSVDLDTSVCLDESV